jgi:hypothetical protein
LVLAARMIHTPVRAGGGMNSAATMAAFGIHHANALVRGLLSQSRELWTISFAMVAMWRSTKWRTSHPTAQPGSAGTEPEPLRTEHAAITRLRP